MLIWLNYLSAANFFQVLRMELRISSVIVIPFYKAIKLILDLITIILYFINTLLNNVNSFLCIIFNSWETCSSLYFDLQELMLYWFILSNIFMAEFYIPFKDFIWYIKNYKNVCMCFSFVRTMSIHLFFKSKVMQFQFLKGRLFKFFEFNEFICFLNIQNLDDIPPKIMPSISETL